MNINMKFSLMEAKIVVITNLSKINIFDGSRQALMRYIEYKIHYCKTL